MNKATSIVVIALMMAGSSAFACNSCGCKSRKAEKAKVECKCSKEKCGCAAKKAEKKQCGCANAEK